jgi:hypothetical protein
LWQHRWWGTRARPSIQSSCAACILKFRRIRVVSSNGQQFLSVLFVKLSDIRGRFGPYE